jgi:hypothetical protein
MEVLKMTDKNYYLVTQAYNKYGHYIGNEESAEELFQLGINPQLAHPENKVCSIGWCEREQKWYGWSHRAMYGFGIGSEVKKGDIAYTASNEEEWIESQVNFWRCEETQNWIRHFTSYVDIYPESYKILVIEYEYNNTIVNEKLHGTIQRQVRVIPESFGRGQWTAETLEDAKQMAIDFADNIA